MLIVGENGVSYGKRPAGAASWREQLLAELGGRIDTSRVHFLGRLPYPQYLAMLQISAAHIYLTYPFVLSWGMLEAMAAGCCIVASRTPPVEEVLRDGENGYLVDFFDGDAIAERVGDALRHPERHEKVRAGARRTIVEQYDLATVCLPAYLKLFDRMIGRRRKAPVATLEALPASAA